LVMGEAFSVEGKLFVYECAEVQTFHKALRSSFTDDTNSLHNDIKQLYKFRHLHSKKA